MILNNDESDILSNSEAEKLGFRKNVMRDFAMQKALCREIRQKAKGCYIPHPFANNCKLKSPGIHQAISILYFHCFFSGSSLFVPIQEQLSGTQLTLYSVAAFDTGSRGRLQSKLSNGIYLLPRFLEQHRNTLTSSAFFNKLVV